MSLRPTGKHHQSTTPSYLKGFLSPNTEVLFRFSPTHVPKVYPIMLPLFQFMPLETIHWIPPYIILIRHQNNVDYLQPNFQKVENNHLQIPQIDICVHSRTQKILCVRCLNCDILLFHEKY